MRHFFWITVTARFLIGPISGVLFGQFPVFWFLSVKERCMSKHFLPKANESVVNYSILNAHHENTGNNNILVCSHQDMLRFPAVFSQSPWACWKSQQLYCLAPSPPDSTPAYLQTWSLSNQTVKEWKRRRQTIDGYRDNSQLSQRGRNSKITSPNPVQKLWQPKKIPNYFCDVILALHHVKGPRISAVM